MFCHVLSNFVQFFLACICSRLYKFIIRLSIKLDNHYQMDPQNDILLKETINTNLPGIAAVENRRLFNEYEIQEIPIYLLSPSHYHKINDIKYFSEIFSGTEVV